MTSPLLTAAMPHLEAAADAIAKQAVADHIAAQPKTPEPPAPFVPRTIGEPLDLSAYTPVFQDDFSTGLGEHWKVTNPTPGWGGELAAFTPDALSMDNGQLVMTARHLPGAYPGRDYITGSIDAPDLAFLYGFLQATVWFEVGNGSHPAIWLYPKAGRWSSEINVMEYDGTFDDHEDRVDARQAEIDAAIAAGKRYLPKPIEIPEAKYDRFITSAHRNNGSENFGELIKARVNGHWRTYGFLWTKDEFTWTLDGKVVRSMENPGIHELMFPIIDLGIGTPNSLLPYGTRTGVLNPADFPMQMKVDQVLIAQPQP